jgi:hypothetical protein
MLMMAEGKQRVMYATLVPGNGGPLMLSDAFDEFGGHRGTKPPPEAVGASVTFGRWPHPQRNSRRRRSR